MAKRYTSKALETVKASGVNSSILEVLTNSAVLESKFGNDELAKEYLKEAFELTLNTYPLNSTIGNISSLFHFIVEEEDENQQ